MYFDVTMKKRVLQVVSEALVPGGLLIVGDVDPIRTVPELSACMTLNYLRPGTYQKPVGVEAKKSLVTT
jgi:chemotaxis methyl-accepting protein methylase